MSRHNKKSLNTASTIVTTQKKNIQAFAGFEVAPHPYLLDDLFTEPTKEQLDKSIIEYIPFSTFDFWKLERLQAIINNSPTTSAIIKQKVAYSCGDGFNVEPAAVNDILPMVRASRIKDVDAMQAEALNDWAKQVNFHGDNLEDLTAKVFTDLYSFGNCFIELKKLQKGGSKAFTMSVLPVTYCRPKKAPKDQLHPTHVGVSSEFEEGYTVTPHKALELPLYPVFERIDGVERSVVHLKFYEPTMQYWGVPDWISAKIWAELEYRIPKFNQSKFENGFTPSAIISLFGSTDSEEAQEVVNALKNCFTGTGNNSKMFVQALRDETSKADVQILNSQSEGEFMDLQAMAAQAIVTGHRWKASLAGIQTAGSLGSNQQIRSEFDVVYNDVIRNVQRLVLNKFLNPVLQDAGIWIGSSWDSISLDIAKAYPVSFAGDIDISAVLTIDEMRKELGFAPLDNQTTENNNGSTN
jgi:capsid portal protein